MNWTNQHKIEFRKVLCFVYRSYSALEIFVSDAIDRSLPEVATPDQLESVCYDIIDYAESKYLLDKLYCYFCQENPQDPFSKAQAAHEFADVLKIDDLNSVTSDDRTILDTLDRFLQEFNLSSDKSRRDRLSEVYRDRPPAQHWETEGNLAYLATRLRQCEHLSNDFRDRCRDYLTRQGHDCETLKRKLTPEQTQPIGQLRHILVKIVSGEAIAFDHDTEVAVWIYAVADGYDPKQLSKPDYINTKIRFGDIPKEVWRVCLARIDHEISPIVHYFLPRLYFDHSFEMEKVTRRKVFGIEHRVVLRTDLVQHSGLRDQVRLQTQWENRWRQAQSKPHILASAVFERACCINEDKLFDQLGNRDFSAFFLDNCDAINAEDYSTVGELIDVAIEEEAIALPIVVWSRHPECKPSLDEIFDDRTTIADVPERIRQLRAACANDAENAIGAHLALIWEDPEIPMPEHAQLGIAS